MKGKTPHLFIYSVVSIIVLLGAIELTTRTISWLSGNGFTLSLHELDPYDRRIKDIYQWHPFTGFTFKPNIRFAGSHPNQEKKSARSTDKHGFLSRNNDLEYRKPPNEIRIATIGGSTTASINLEYDQNWPGYIGNLLKDEFPAKDIRVINAGTPGFDTAQGIGNLALRVMPFNPDIVIIYHAYNDLKAIRPNRTFRPDYSHLHTAPYGEHKEPHLLIKLLNNSMFYVRMRNSYREHKNAVDKYEQLNLRGKGKNRLSHVPQEALETFKQNIRRMIAIARAGDAKVILSTFASLHNPKLDWSQPETFHSSSEFQKRCLGGIIHFNPGLNVEGVFDGLSRYNALLREVAAQEKCSLVDNANLIPHEDQYFVDRVHFSNLGARRMALNLFPAVADLMRGSNLN